MAQDLTNIRVSHKVNFEIKHCVAKTPLRPELSFHFDLLIGEGNTGASCASPVVITPAGGVIGCGSWLADDLGKTNIGGEYAVVGTNTPLLNAGLHICASGEFLP